MSNTAAKHTAGSGAAGGASPSAAKRSKVAAFLVTADEELWPLIGAHLPAKLNFRQVDSVGELLDAAGPDSPAVVVWDARLSGDKSAELSRIQSHSASFAMLVLDEDDSAWGSAIQHGQIVSFVAVPVDQSRIIGALGAAYEEVNARVALLGERSTAPSETGGGGRRFPKVLIGGAAAVALAVGAALFIFRSGDHGGSSNPQAPEAPSPSTASPASSPSAAAPQAAGAATAEDKAEALIDQAQRAMRDRHFIDPLEGSALALYRSALVLDPSNGEARQGLQRLSEVLLARVQSALDERQFDAALQALETVRSIDPDDKRLSAFDERIAKMRAELGPAEILAAINAQNFDRAAQLIDQASRSKSVAEPKLNQLRQELQHRRADSNASRLAALVDARMQQDQLLEPPTDSAVYYFNQARKAGASVADLQPQQRELSRRLIAAAHAHIAQMQLDDADRLANELRSIGTPLSQVAALQHDIGVARAQSAPAAAPEQARFADLARTRLAQGSVVDPQNDSALHYLTQLKAADPQNAAIPQLSKAIQALILTQARDALDASQYAQAGSLLQAAAGLGSSPDADALRDRLRSAQTASAGPREVAEGSLTRTRTLDIDYPRNALTKKTEGQVEVAYIVTPKGMISDLTVLSATPAGVFEKAATDAVSRLRYKPVLDGGKPIAVSTKMLVTFRLAN